MSVKASRPRLGCVALLLFACQGQLSGRDDAAAPPASLPTGGTGGAGGSPGPNIESGPSDEELRAKDPELFDIALGYFPSQSPAAAKKRLSRLTREQLDLTAASLFPGKRLPLARETMPRDPLQTNYEYAANLGFSAANFTPFTQWVEQLSEQVSEQVSAEPSGLVGCSADDESCLGAAAKSFVRRAFRGVVSDAELERYAAFFRRSASKVGLPRATADLVSLTLTAPGYAFREEVQTDANARLLPAQLLQHLSYTLTDSPPDATGLPPASAPLDDAALGQTVDALLATPAARTKLLRFFTAWLEIRDAKDFDISTEVFPEFTPEVAAAVVSDTEQFLRQQLAGALPVLRDVTEASVAVTSAPSSFLYGLSDPVSGRFEPDPAERLGIFSQPAVIASHSGPTTTRLVKRGVFFTRKVMCLPLGVPPAGVDTTLPEDLTGSERERIESVTTPARCAGCHGFINPFGFMQESYDAIGRYRREDAGKPVDASISVSFLDEGPFNARTAVEALRGFTRSLRFQQCFTRQLFRFYSGRDEDAGDDALLRRLFFDFASNDSQSILTLLRSLATATSYSARTEAP